MTNENTAFTNLQFGIPASEIAAILRCLPPFDETNLAALTKLVGRGRLLALHPGEVLLAQGEASDAAYIIIEGSASIRIETSYGTVNLSTISAPALVGEIGVFMGSRVPPLLMLQSWYALCALIAATCKNSVVKIRDFLLG